MRWHVVSYTHKGWFLLCPIYIGDIDSEAPCLEERLAIFYPLLVLSELLFGLAVELMLLLDPLYEPRFPIVITGRLRQHISRVIGE